LQELALDYELPKQLIMEHRSLSKLKSYLYRQAAGLINPEDRAHSHLLPSGGDRDRAALVIGSQSAEHPDPHRGRAAYPPGVRCALAGYQVVAADYSQIELRIMAHLSGETRACSRLPGKS
jgi:DNA polymerase-1